MYPYDEASLVAQTVKRLSTMQETWVWSLGQEDPLEKEMATHSSTIAWKIPWTEEPSRLQSMESQIVGHDGATSLHFTPVMRDVDSGEVACMGVGDVWGKLHLPLNSDVSLKLL